MDFSCSPKEEAFRQEICDWLAKNVNELPEWWSDHSLKRPDLDSREFHEFSIWWHKKLYDAGFVGISWPREYGGRGAGVLEQVVFSEEMARAKSSEVAFGYAVYHRERIAQLLEMQG